ncbi:hypothetical protein ACFU6I_39785 [Streptomyces sp. NPDC057486]|uniref:hypothetical protein n=1 Tax=Streptomyces sp. NPDC057486 TaxID=3346145 RepID=UPI00367B216F
MTSRTFHRAAVAIASTAIAAAGLLATGGSASAATHPSSSQSGATSATRIAEHHHSGDRHSAFGGWAGDGRGYWNRDHDRGRYWIRYDDRDGYRAQIDEGRRQWVLDQIRWADGHEHTYLGLEHHDRSHR